MRKIIDFNVATLASLFILGILALFHIAILMGIVLFDYVPIEFLWGGQMKTVTQLVNFEIVSLLTTVIFIFLLLIRSKWINLPKLLGVTRIVMWMVFVLFLLNTIGNGLSKTTFERAFAIISGVLALLFLRIAIEKKG
ncbi:hypothetical protein K8354_04375 [Polaribacter litorisediminis]|uniref:hypothetical protein n=1 Tax=Polaribacter litorisediminis TaxID=1908341 RepID=UPI001CBF5F73|nr:hypothetical protein [Polaribacter litorisediminis]UAM99066.1 hypothetical protein K8354_04375 [Polaribacter litorisediminis]